MLVNKCVHLGSCVNQARLSLGRYLRDSLVSLVMLGWISLGLEKFSGLFLNPNLLYKDFLAWFSAWGMTD